MSDTGADPQVGSLFGPYRLTRLLGRGGMGEVYEAEDTRKHRMVALKLISSQYSDNPLFRARMQREADTAGRLNEPHIVPIHDYGEIDRHFFVEMRLIDGASLRTLLAHYGPMVPARAVAIVEQIAAALDAAHAAGVTHRDVKPENILVTGSDFAYLVDFGIARAAGDPALTQMGTTIGTYNYMAPERFTGDEVTYRADIYSLACVLGECLTGTPPYQTESVERLIAAHLLEPPPRPSQLRPGQVPPGLDQVIAKGMAKNPHERYRTAGDLAASAHDALTAPEQRQATTILRQGEPATLRPQAAPYAETQAQPIASGAPAGWASQTNHATPFDGVGFNGAGRSTYAQQRYTRGPDFGSGATGRHGKKFWAIVAAVALVLITAVAVTGYLVSRPSSSSSQQATGQTVLPFTGIDFRLSPSGVALDSDGNIYVTSEGMYGRVVKLTTASGATTILPFNGLYQAQGLAVDGAGTVYVTDFNNRVVALAAGSNTQKVLPFTGLNYPEGVSVDGQGNVFVADRGNSRVVKLAAGGQTQTVLPFAGLKDPDGVAVDPAGNVYVTDTDNNRVVRLDAASNTPTVLDLEDLSVPWGIAVDNAGTVYITEHDKNQVVKYAAGSSAPTVLPFNGLNTPLAVAVDKNGSVYVADRGNDRVVKLTG